MSWRFEKTTTAMKTKMKKRRTSQLGKKRSEVAAMVNVTGGL